MAFLFVVVCDVVRPSLTLRACLSWCRWFISFVPSPCCARPLPIVVCYGFGGFVEVLQ